jgi:hypothetical protein
MRHRILTVAAAATTVLVLAGSAVALPVEGEGKGSVPKAGPKKQVDPVQCMSIDLHMVLEEGDTQAFLHMQWSCPGLPYAAHLAVEIDGVRVPGAEAYVENASLTQIAQELVPAQLERRYEICGRGVAMVQQLETEVHGLECISLDARKLKTKMKRAAGIPRR